MICEKCKKDILDEFKVCPYCANPIDTECLIPKNQENDEKEMEQFPNLPSNLYIGSFVTNWYGDSILNVKCVRTPNAPYIFDNNFINLKRCTNGLEIASSLKIHESQIIKMYVLNEQIEVADNGSVVSGAIVGGLLFGGVGAIVGGMSQANKNGKTVVYNNSLCIEFWDIKSRKKQTLQFVSNEYFKYNKFINACEQNLEMYPTYSTLSDESKKKIEDEQKRQETSDNNKLKLSGRFVAVAVVLFIIGVISTALAGDSGEGFSLFCIVISVFTFMIGMMIGVFGRSK